MNIHQAAEEYYEKYIKPNYPAGCANVLAYGDGTSEVIRVLIDKSIYPHFVKKAPSEYGGYKVIEELRQPTITGMQENICKPISF